MNLKEYIAKVNSWNDFKTILESKTKLEKGKAFEELTKYYLDYNPIYKTKLKNVWLQKEVPSSVLKKLNLPSNDQGIDLIAETNEGTFWAIQCKYLQDEDQRLSHRAISTFVSLSTGIAENITYCLVCTTVDEYAKIYKGKENIGFCNSEEWRKLDKTFFDWLRNKFSGKEKKLIAYKPKSHQTKALKEATSYFIKEKNQRGKLVFPCGAGKSLTGYWITRELKSKSIIVAVPSLSLVKQTLEVYLRESVANNDSVAWLCVCSDEGIGKNDDVAIHTNEIGVPCVTDNIFIAKWLNENSKKKTIIFTTYQSGKTIAEACKIANHSFDLGIMDEAHKTVGLQDKLFSHLLFEKNIKIHKRIFMTATERRYAGSSDEVLSMDDPSVYGETFTQMSFKEAIDIGILSDYRIITLFISNEEVKSLIEKNAFVKPTGKEWDQETEARTLASLIALRKAMTEYPIHHAVTFHSSIKKAEAFEQSQSVFSSAYPQFTNVESFHVSGAMPTSKRGKIVDEFAQTDKGIITNAKCLTEGVDVPNIDCVLFADPRKSTVDIVQAVGRALRKKEGKEFGYVILPVFTESNNTEEIIESEEFKEILSTIRALASNDERIIEYFKDVSLGIKKARKDSLVQFDIDVQLSERINEKELIDSIQLKTWNKLAKLSWMPFEEARSYAHKLGIKSQIEWREIYSKSDDRSEDIPKRPDHVYKTSGWVSWHDWLGNTIKEYRSFEEAKKFIHKLGLKSDKEWREYRKSKEKPNDIPATPDFVYKKKGWKSSSDWLGTSNIQSGQRDYKTYEEAKECVHKLGIKSKKEWMEYCKSGDKPEDIPSSPNTVYKDNGWTNLGDWLGTSWLSFIEAKAYVHKLELKSSKEWDEYCKSGEKPRQIPTNPNITYKGNGWKSMGDWIGNGRVGWKSKGDRRNEKVESSSLDFRSFEDAKEFVHKLSLTTVEEWNSYCKSGIKPNDIPKSPQSVYKEFGWKGVGDWLGTGRIQNRNRKFRGFNEAKDFVHRLGLKSNKQWEEYCKSGSKPFDIPVSPSNIYKKKGYIGMADWLGYEDVFQDFKEARKFVQGLKLKSWGEWKEYCRSGKKPKNIPANPNVTYKEKGWHSVGDWLGTNIKHNKYKNFRDFTESKQFVIKLGLKSRGDWRRYCSSGDKPEDIPSRPDLLYKDVGWIGFSDFFGKKE